MSDLSDLDNLLAELDSIDTTKPGPVKATTSPSVSANRAPVRASVSVQAAVRPTPTPISVKATVSTPTNQKTDWDELDALVAKFEPGSDPRKSVAPAQQSSPRANNNTQSTYGAFPSPSRASSVINENYTSFPSRQSAAVDLNTLKDLDEPPSRLPPTNNSYNARTTTSYAASPVNNNTNNYIPPADNGSNRRTTTMYKSPPAIPEACPSCGQMVTGEHMLASGKKWHMGHFACTDCSAQIVGDFYEHEGKPKCRNCFETRYNCSKCGYPISGEYFVGGGKMLHAHCVDRHMCGRCNSVIEATSRELKALDQYWHPQCFSCAGCSSPLTGAFYSISDQPYCERCSNSRNGGTTSGTGSNSCASCSRPIGNGTFISYEGRSYHSDCFVCSKCRTPLNHTSFYTVNGQPTCSRCAQSR